MKKDNSEDSNVIDFGMYQLRRICDRINENKWEDSDNYLIEIARELQSNPKQVDD